MIAVEAIEWTSLGKLAGFVDFLRLQNSANKGGEILRFEEFCLLKVLMKSAGVVCSERGR